MPLLLSVPWVMSQASPTTEAGVDDSFIKDHLGNIRMVLTEEQKQDVYPAATLEGDINKDGGPNAASVLRRMRLLRSVCLCLACTLAGDAAVGGESKVIIKTPAS